MCIHFMLVFVFLPSTTRGIKMEIQEAIHQIKELIEIVNASIEVNEAIVDAIMKTISQ